MEQENIKQKNKNNVVKFEKQNISEISKASNINKSFTSILLLLLLLLLFL